MKLRTYIAILLGVLVVVVASALALQNRDVLFVPFALTDAAAIPLYAALVGAFLLGLLPPLVLVLVRSLQDQLSRRRDRRRRREVESFEHRARRALDLEADGRHGRAAEEYETLLAERPEDFGLLLRHGEALRRLDRAGEALEVHRKASVLYPNSTAVLYQLAADYEALGDHEVAREVRNRLLRDFPGQGLAVLRRRRDAAMAAGRWDDAFRWQEKIGILRGGQRGGLRGGERDTPLEDRALEEGVSDGLTYQRGLSLLERDRADEAIEIFRRLRDDEPRFVPAAILYGEAMLLQDDEAAALAAWRAGFAETGSPIFLQRLEDYFIEIGDPSRGIETLHALAAKTEQDILVRFYLGRLYVRLEMLDEAQKTLDALAEPMDSSPIYHFLVGRIRERRDDRKAAAQHYRRALDLRGVPDAAFRCRHCRKRTADWRGRCESCGKWNTVDLDIGGALSPEDLGLVERPYWGGYVDPAVTDLDDLEAEAAGA